MTISLEEHVARALSEHDGFEWASPFRDQYRERWRGKARAAIAAVHEWEGAEIAAMKEELDQWREVFIDERGEVWRRPTAWAYAQACRVRDNSAESERAACEAIAREMSKKYLQLAEPMKRPTTRSYFEKAANALDHAADAIAARGK